MSRYISSQILRSSQIRYDPIDHDWKDQQTETAECKRSVRIPGFPSPSGVSPFPAVLPFLPLRSARGRGSRSRRGWSFPDPSGRTPAANLGRRRPVSRGSTTVSSHSFNSQISNRGSRIPEVLLVFTSKCPSEVQISQGLGAFFHISFLKTDCRVPQMGI